MFKSKYWDLISQVWGETAGGVSGRSLPLEPSKLTTPICWWWWQRWWWWSRQGWWRWWWWWCRQGWWWCRQGWWRWWWWWWWAPLATILWSHTQPIRNADSASRDSALQWDSKKGKLQSCKSFLRNSLKKQIVLELLAYWQIELFLCTRYDYGYMYSISMIMM